MANATIPKACLFKTAKLAIASSKRNGRTDEHTEPRTAALRIPFATHFAEERESPCDYFMHDSPPTRLLQKI